MSEVVKNALVKYSAQQMFDLVFDVNKYSEFLPWCSDSVIKEQDDEKMVASLSVSYHGLNKKFITQNNFVKNQKLEMKLLDGPFKYLDGIWQFKDFDKGSRLDFNLTFEFDNFIIQKVANKTFTQIANEMLDCFIKRAEIIYE